MPGRPKELLRLRGVSRRYGEHQALLPVDLGVHIGECVVLVGPNGSGKSTLLRIAAGRDEASSGEVGFDGRPLSEEDPRTRARIAVVTDTSAYYPDLTVREHLMLVAVSHGMGHAADEWVEPALEDQGLADCGNRLPSSLSAGQLQGLFLASALVRPCELLILDEPEQHLDPGARRRLGVLLLRVKAERVAVLLATHDVELARSVADRVLVLGDGRVIGCGDPANVLSSDSGHASSW